MGVYAATDGTVAASISVNTNAELWQAYSVAVPTPNVTDVDTDEIITDDQAGVTITGTNFAASSNTVTLEYAVASKSATQIINTEGTTSIDIDVVLGNVPHTQNSNGTNLPGIGDLELQVEDDGGLTGSLTIELAPRTGTQVVSLGTSIDQTSASLLQQPAILPGSMTLAENDQIQHDTTTTNGHALTVNADGTFSIDGGTGTDSFAYRVWTAADGRTEWITATVEGDVINAPAPVSDGDPFRQLSVARSVEGSVAFSVDY